MDGFLLPFSRFREIRFFFFLQTMMTRSLIGRVKELASIFPHLLSAAAAFFSMHDYFFRENRRETACMWRQLNFTACLHCCPPFPRWGSLESTTAAKKEWEKERRKKAASFVSEEASS